MFRRVTLTGTGGALVWGYRPIAQWRRWTIARAAAGHVWTLSGPHDSLDARLLSKPGLVFTAPRPGRAGLWCFPVRAVTLGVDGALRVTLADPEY